MRRMRSSVNRTLAVLQAAELAFNGRTAAVRRRVLRKGRRRADHVHLAGSQDPRFVPPQPAERRGRQPAGTPHQVRVSTPIAWDAATGMERLWSRAVATGGNRWQMGEPPKGPKKAQTVAVGCDRLPRGVHGKEGVDRARPCEPRTRCSSRWKQKVGRRRVSESTCEKTRDTRLSPPENRRFAGISDPQNKRMMGLEPTASCMARRWREWTGDARSRQLGSIPRFPRASD